MTALLCLTMQLARRIISSSLSSRHHLGSCKFMHWAVQALWGLTGHREGKEGVLWLVAAGLASALGDSEELDMEWLRHETQGIERG